MSLDEADPLDPSVWWRGLVDAIAGLHRGDRTLADEYVAFVRKHRGDKVAEQTIQNIRQYRRSPRFATCAEWHKTNYLPARGQ